MLLCDGIFLVFDYQKIINDDSKVGLSCVYFFLVLSINPDHIVMLTTLSSCSFSCFTLNTYLIGL
jgi:hypothetical protein